VIDTWNPFHRYQVMQEVAVETLDGQQDVLPTGFAEVEHLKLGSQINMPLERVKLMLMEGEIARLIFEGKMRKL
jgi:hypothetical protein